MDGEQLVVGVALVVAGRVLAARRTSPPELAGRWELPGGKVAPGEDPADAAVREVREELGCEVRVTGWLAAEVAIDTGPAKEERVGAGGMSERSVVEPVHAGAGPDGTRSLIAPARTAPRSGPVLRVAVAELVAGEPVPVEHDATAWLRADQLTGPAGWAAPGWLDWLESDRPFLPLVAGLLEPAEDRS